MLDSLRHFVHKKENSNADIRSLRLRLDGHIDNEKLSAQMEVMIHDKVGIVSEAAIKLLVPLADETMKATSQKIRKARIEEKS